MVLTMVMWSLNIRSKFEFWVIYTVDFNDRHISDTQVLGSVNSKTSDEKCHTIGTVMLISSNCLYINKTKSSWHVKQKQ